MGDYLSTRNQNHRDSLEDGLSKLVNGLQPDPASSGGILIANGALTVNGVLTHTGVAAGQNLALTSIASIATANIYSPSATLNALTLGSTVLSNPTIAPLQVIASTASQSFFNFYGAVISTASLNLAANKVAGAIQVTYSGGGGQGIGYIPIFTGVV